MSTQTLGNTCGKLRRVEIKLNDQWVEVPPDRVVPIHGSDDFTFFVAATPPFYPVFDEEKRVPSMCQGAVRIAKECHRYR